MRKWILGIFVWGLVFAGDSFGETYESKHFTIYSDLDPRYVKVVQANAEAYFTDMVGRYFKNGGGKRVKIYFSETQSDTFKLLRKRGHKNKTNRSFYVYKDSSIYTHRFTKGGHEIEIGTLFHEITHHMVRLNFKDPPIWLNEGLACFLGNETRIVRGKAVVGQPNPWRERELKERIEKGIRPNLKRLFPMTQKELYKWPIGYNFSRALFYWLHESGKLEEYLQNAEKDGYDISVLEKTVNKSVNEINKELLEFIQKYCYAGAYVHEGQRVRSKAKEKEMFTKAVELLPDYSKGLFELGLCYYREKDYDNCRKYLNRILEDPDSIHYMNASDYIGRCYYYEKDYPKALEYFKKALAYSEYYDRSYKICFWIANCYHYMKDHAGAQEFYKIFFDNNWEPEDMAEQVKYAENYQKRDVSKSGNKSEAN